MWAGDDKAPWHIAPAAKNVDSLFLTRPFIYYATDTSCTRSQNKTIQRAKISAFQTLNITWFYLLVEGIIWLSCLKVLRTLPFIIFPSTRNCMTKTLFMTFCCIQYAKKRGSTALSMESTFQRVQNNRQYLEKK